jgi:hypothetical protein
MTLWNVVLKCPSNLPNAPFQPLHGQLLGLHPASALLIATPRGQRILGDLVSALLANGDIPKPQDILQTISKMPQFNDLSHALVFAAEVYMERRDELRQQRRSRGSRNIEDLERRGKIVAHRTVPRRSRADRQASATNARISKKKIQRAFKQYAKEKNFTCPGNEGCELAYLNHEKIADSDSVSDQVRVTYQCRRHHKKFDVAVSEDELSQVLSELGGGDHSA